MSIFSFKGIKDRSNKLKIISDIRRTFADSPDIWEGKPLSREKFSKTKLTDLTDKQADELFNYLKTLKDDMRRQRDLTGSTPK